MPVGGFEIGAPCFVLPKLIKKGEIKHRVTINHHLHKPKPQNQRSRQAGGAVQNAKLPIIMRSNQRTEFHCIALPDWHDAGNNLKMDIMLGGQTVQPRLPLIMLAAGKIALCITITKQIIPAIGSEFGHHHITLRRYPINHRDGKAE